MTLGEVKQAEGGKSEPPIEEMWGKVFGLCCGPAKGEDIDIDERTANTPTADWVEVDSFTAEGGVYAFVKYLYATTQNNDLEHIKFRVTKNGNPMFGGGKPLWQSVYQKPICGASWEEMCESHIMLKPGEKLAIEICHDGTAPGAQVVFTRIKGICFNL